MEVNKSYTIPIIVHNFLVFPGETVPMILTANMLNDDGALIGLVFRELRNNHNFNLYGVTCLIYEKRTDEIGNLSIKTRAYQRFVIKNTEYVRNSFFFNSSLQKSTILTFD